MATVVERDVVKGALPPPIAETQPEKRRARLPLGPLMPASQ